MKHVIIIALSLILIALVGCSSDKAAKTSSGPTFKVNDVNGTVRTFEEFKGKGPLIVNFWGTWCPPCRREIPDMIKIYNEYKGSGLEIVGLAVRDKPENVKAFAQQFGVEWVLLMSNHDAMKSFATGTGVPVSIFFDRDGNEVSRFVGGRPYEVFKAEVEKII